MVKTRRSIEEQFEPAHTSNKPPGISKTAMWRTKLKENPEKYHDFLLKERERNKIRRSLRSVEEIKQDQVKSNLRLKEWRSKKQKPKSKEKAVFVKKIQDMTSSEKTEYFRVRQAEYRKAMTPQKKAKVAKRQRNYRLKKKKTLAPNDNNTLKTASTAAIRVISHRLKKKLPDNAIQFAQTISHIVKNSPKKQAAITDYMSTPLHLQFNSLKKKMKELKYKRNLVSKIELNVLRSISATSTNKKKKKRAIKLLNQKIKRRLKISRETLDHFYMRGDISRPVPRVRNTSKFKIMYIMETTLKNAFKRFCDEHENTNISFSTFARHRPKNVKLTSTNLVTCQCEICVNILQKINTLRRVTVQCRMKNPDVTFPNVPVTVYELNKLTLCSNPNLKCHERGCDSCGSNKIMEYFSLLTSEAEVKWMKFEKCDKERKQYKDDKLVITQKSTKEYVNHSGSVNELLDELQEELETFSLHLYNAFYQLNAFNSLINNLPDKWLVSVQDFSENYAAKYQFEPQSAYYDKTSMTLHPTVLFYREGDKIVREGVTFVTEDLKHDHSAVWTFRKKVLEHINFAPLYHVGWSDGCAAQYKSREPFLDISFNQHDFASTYEHCFYGSRHAKGPSDAEGAVIKTWVTRKVSNGALVRNAQEFANVCAEFTASNNSSKYLSRRAVIYVDAAEIAETRSYLKQRGPSKTLPGTRKIHCVKCVNYPGRLKIRSRSCFCPACISFNYAECHHKDTAGEFQDVILVNLSGHFKENDIQEIDKFGDVQDDIQEIDNSDDIDASDSVQEMDKLPDGENSNNSLIHTVHELTKRSYQADGQYILVNNGSTSFPAVVANWPWVIFYKPVAGNLFIEDEKRFTIIDSDVIRVLSPPSIEVKGHRLYFRFEEQITEDQC